MLFSVFAFLSAKYVAKFFKWCVLPYGFLREAGTFWIVYGRDTIGPRTTCNQVELHLQERFREFIFGWCVKDFSRKFRENSVKAVLNMALYLPLAVCQITHPVPVYMQFERISAGQGG